MKTFLARFAQNESGATAIEYGLIAAFIGVGIIVGLTQLRAGLNGLFAEVNTNLGNAVP
jgi:pilus assembly protein Flp/PilA